MQDKVYSKAQTHIVDFAFTDEVAAVFPDMIRRSVPGYETVIPMTGLIAARHLGATGKALDLGCSLGATTKAILSQTDAADVSVIGVDNSPAMIERARQINTDPRAEFIEADIQSQAAIAHFHHAKVILLNFVLQFIEPASRLSTLKQLHRCLPADGLLIVSEKIQSSDPATHALFDETHLAWKRANGYSDLEVSQKRSAIENVMVVDPVETHVERFQTAGFSHVTQWYQCMNWASFLVQP
ncbi:MAG: tRNA (cmo5U34)-methyltransferase [Limisphaerales bacterium]|jgi:tRNA (cmo5U34)-methyltransferase